MSEIKVVAMDVEPYGHSGWNKVETLTTDAANKQLSITWGHYYIEQVDQFDENGELAAKFHRVGDLWFRIGEHANEKVTDELVIEHLNVVVEASRRGPFDLNR
jgi:hypothetical protein